MTTDPTPVDRIPLTRSVHYVARGLPEVPNQYGPGVLAPSEITLTYRAAPDSQLGRVHAYVTGRIWVDGKELPLLPGGLYGQHYMDGLDNWPAWLAEEARLHDPERAASAGLGVSATPSHTDELAALAVNAGRALQDEKRHYEIACQENARLRLMVDEYGAGAGALTDKLKRVRDMHRETCPLALGQLKPPAFVCGMCEVLDAPAAPLRRLADEAQQQPTDRDVVEAHDAALSFTLKADHAQLQPEPSVHGESVAHLAGLHGRRDQRAEFAGGSYLTAEHETLGMIAARLGGDRLAWEMANPWVTDTTMPLPAGLRVAIPAQPAVDARQDVAPRSRVARFLDALTHSGPGYDLTPVQPTADPRQDGAQQS